MIEFKTLNQRDDWNEVVRASPYGTIFHTFEWIEILEKQYKIQKIPLGIFENGDLIGIFPSFFQRKAFLKILVSPLHEAATPYGGPIVDKNKINDVITLFDTYSEFADYYDITFAPKYNLNEKQHDTSHFVERKTYILNLDHPLDLIWKNLNKKCRNAIRKAENNNITVVEGDSKQDLEDFWKMTEVTFHKWGTKSPISIDYVKAVFDVLYPKKQFKMIFAEHDGERIGGAIILSFADRMYYWQGASYPEYYQFAPNNLIQWYIIEWALKNGFRTYDMLGANIPSIAKFKGSFGGDLVKYSYIQKSHSPIADAGRRAYVWWRKNVRQDLV